MSQAPTPSLWPREHGATAQLLVTLTCALVAGPLQAAPIGAATAFLLLFLAAEPLLVNFGLRGQAAQTLLAAKARTRALVFLGTGGLSLTITLLNQSPRLALGFVVPGSLALALGLVVRFKGLYGPWAETMAAITLASLAFPLRYLAIAHLKAAALFTLLLMLQGLLATLAVRLLLAHRNAPTGWRYRALPPTACLGLSGFFLLLDPHHPLPRLTPFVLLPLGLATLHLALFPPAKVRTVGWLLATATSMGALILTQWGR